MTLDFSDIINLIGIVLMPLVTYLLGKRQRENESNRVPAQNTLELSQAWKNTMEALEKELDRVRSGCDEHEKEFTDRLDDARKKLEETEALFTEFKRKEEAKYVEISAYIRKLEDGVDALVKQIEDAGDIPVFRRE